MTIATETQCEQALRESDGLVAQAARALGMSRQGLHLRIAASDYLQSVIRDIEEETLDVAEGVIRKALKNDDGPTARWYAERKGKQRGYATKSEVENRIADDQMEALVLAMGGDVEKLAALKGALEG